MKRIFIQSTLIFFTLVLIASCNKQINQDRVKLTIKAYEAKSSKIQIGTIDMLLSQDSILFEAKLDSNGVGTFQFNLAKPTSAYIQMDDKSYPLYIEPGNDMTISISATDDENVIAFTGRGSEANNYLVQVSSLRENFVNAEGIFIWQLDQEALIDRLDSMRHAFDDFHRSYTDTVELTPELSESLKKRNRLSLVVLKENHALVHYSDNLENPKLTSKKRKRDLKSQLMKFLLIQPF